MQPFTYIYKGEIHESSAIHYLDGGNTRYRVTLGNGFWLVIVPTGFPGVGGSTIWVQSNKPGEVIQPNDLIQSIGEGLETSGVALSPVKGML